MLLPNSELTKPNGDKRIYGPDGRATTDVDYSHPTHHPDLPVPHVHDWNWNGDQPSRGPAYDPSKKKKDNNNQTVENVEKAVITIGGSYLIYRAIRMIPSLFPPGWWSIPANLVTP